MRRLIKFKVTEDIKKKVRDIKSQALVDYLDIGRVKISSGYRVDHEVYLLIADGVIYLISPNPLDKDIYVQKIHIDELSGEDALNLNIGLHSLYSLNPKFYGNNPRFYGDYSIILTNLRKKKILDYKRSLLEKQKMKLKEFETEVDKLAKIKDANIMLENFLVSYTDDLFKNILTYSSYIDRFTYENFGFVATFSNPEHNVYASEYRMDNYELNALKLVRIFERKQWLKEHSNKEIQILKVTLFLKPFLIKIYGGIFEKSYQGYFPEIERYSITDCIQLYSTIDLLEKDDERNLSLFCYYLLLKEKSIKNDFYELFDEVKEKVNEILEVNQLNQFEQSLLHKHKPVVESNSITIDDVDMMTGRQFELFVAKLFEKMGHSINLTKATGDQGVDVIAVKNLVRTGIQAKRSSTPISNKAIQEVVGGLRYYNLEKGLVITNNYFTKSANELADSNDIILWDRSLLKEKIEELF